MHVANAQRNGRVIIDGYRTIMSERTPAEQHKMHTERAGAYTEFRMSGRDMADVSRGGEGKARLCQSSPKQEALFLVRKNESIACPLALATVELASLVP